MPIYMELLVMLLVTYFVGLGIGWVLFARSPGEATEAGRNQDTDPDTGVSEQ